VAQHGNQLPGVGGGEAQRVNEKVGSAADHAAERFRIVAIRGMKTGAFDREAIWHPRLVAPDEIEDPA
jgi:hypothetical protein